MCVCVCVCVCVCGVCVCVCVCVRTHVKKTVSNQQYLLSLNYLPVDREKNFLQI